MNILVLNSGSSSVKFQLLSLPSQKLLVKGLVDGIGLDTCKVSVDGATIKKKFKNHNSSLSYILDLLKKYSIDLIGHRVVHGGEYFSKATKITAAVIKKIKDLSELAPLHNPANLAGILVCKKLLPKISQVAVFDTAFHQTIPKEAYLYAIPMDYYTKYKIRKYGFHGTSHKYVMLEASKLLKKKNPTLLTCHLGNGSSITAIKKGKSINTSMGFTPLQGLIMGTRCGDLDPGIVPFLQKKTHYTSQEIELVLNKKSGLLGIDGFSDMRTIHEKSLKGNKLCTLAIDMLTYDIVTYLGAYWAITGPIDGIVFTGGMGEKAYYLRKKIIDAFNHFGVKLNASANKRNSILISKKDSKVKVLVIPTNEELMIAKESYALLKK